VHADAAAVQTYVKHATLVNPCIMVLSERRSICSYGPLCDGPLEGHSFLINRSRLWDSHGEALSPQSIQATIQVDAAVVHADEVGVPGGRQPASGADLHPGLVLQPGMYGVQQETAIVCIQTLGCNQVGMGATQRTDPSPHICMIDPARQSGLRTTKKHPFGSVCKQTLPCKRVLEKGVVLV